MASYDGEKYIRTATGEVINTTDVSRDIYSKDFVAGTVVLGGNRPSGASSMYNVIIKNQE